jgi:hypothetical protein
MIGLLSAGRSRSSVITCGMGPNVPRSPSEREVQNVPKVTAGSHKPKADHIAGKSHYRPRKAEVSMGEVMAEKKT